jgi:hypothetical protein
MAPAAVRGAPGVAGATAGTDAEAVVTEVAKLAVCGRAGTEVIHVTAPDITEVPAWGVRASDEGSIYRRSNEERYGALAHLDAEQQILTAAARTVPQLVTAEQARATAERTGLDAGQRDAVVTMLTAATATTAARVLARRRGDRGACPWLSRSRRRGTRGCGHPLVRPHDPVTRRSVGHRT